ncbi:Suppressor of cytokine signaling 7, partial [Xenoophorus captivus]
TFSLWCHPKFEDRCHSVVEFIERAIMHSKNGKFLYFLRSRVPGLPPTPVQLLYPVSRFSNVKSLQHLCRFCIRQIVRIDHIEELPLPRSLMEDLSVLVGRSSSISPWRIVYGQTGKDSRFLEKNGGRKNDVSNAEDLRHVGRGNKEMFLSK